MTATYERKGPVAYITLARSDAMNAMDRRMYKAVNEAFYKLNEDKEAKVAILSSSNPDAFCAGVDIRDIHKAMTEEGLALDDLHMGCFARQRDREIAGARIQLENPRPRKRRSS